VTKNIKGNDDVLGENDMTESQVEQAMKLKMTLTASRKKNVFTVEDLIAKNLDDLCREQEEYSRNKDGKRRMNATAWKKILVNSLFMGFSLTNTLVGAGILSFSQSASKMGILGFCGWSIFTIVFILITWYYWNKAIYLTGASTMGELLSLIFGKGFAALVDVCNTGFFYCVMMCYQIITTQYIIGIVSDLAGDKFDTTLAECYGGKTVGVFCKWHYIILYLVVLCLNIPLIIPKSVNFLNKMSTFAVASAFITTFAVMIKAIIAGAKGVSSNGIEGQNIPTMS
jgi:hypothetical protein